MFSSRVNKFNVPNNSCDSLKQIITRDGVIAEIIFKANKTGTIKMIGLSWKLGHRFTWRQKKDDIKVYITIQELASHDPMYETGRQMSFLTMGRDFILFETNPESFFVGWLIDR